MWVDHLLAKKRTRSPEGISKFVEGSVELNCIMVRHGSQKGKCDSDVYATWVSTISAGDIIVF